MNEETPQDESQTQPPVEETAPAVEETAPVEAPEANETDVTDETPGGDNATVEGADIQASAPETQEDEEEETFVAPTQPQPVDIQSYIDANGNLDVAAFNAAQAAQTQAAIQAAVQQAANERKYERTWDRAYEAYPELKKNKELRNMVQAIHANSPVTGKYLSPKQAAEKFFGFAGAAKQQGIKAATQTRTTQAAASLGVTGVAAAPTTNKIAQLRDQMANGSTIKERNDATRATLEELVRSGAI